MLVTVFAASFLSGVSPACPETIEQPGEMTGEWAGEARLDDMTWEVEVVIGSADDGPFATVSLPEWVVHGQDVELVGLSDNAVCFEWVIWESRFALAREGDTLIGRWEASHQDLEDAGSDVSLTRISDQALRFSRTDHVFVSADGTELTGTLIRPAGVEPHGVIIWTHGSGPDTRSTLHYASRAFLAAEEGAASFIFDKRGAGESGGQTPTMEQTIADAMAAFDHVSALPGVGADRIFVGGYSQGGWVSPAVASRRPVAGVIVGSAPGITPGEQNIYNFEAEAVGLLNADEIRLGADTLRATYEYYHTGEGLDSVLAVLNDPANAGWATHPFYRNLLLAPEGDIPTEIDPADYAPLLFDSLPDWRVIDVPVLAVWGSEDRSVPAERSRDLIAAALEDAGASDVTLIVFPDTGHGLMRERPGDWEYARAADGYPELLRTWIREHVAEH